MSKRRAMAFVILSALVAGCRSPQPATAVPTACGGEFAFVMTTVKSGDLHLADACHVSPLALPDEAGPELDGWVSCGPADPSTFPAWSPDGNRLLYVSDYYYSGHGEVRVLDTSTRNVRTLTPSYVMLDAATGRVVKENCAYPDECHFSEIRDGQVTFVNSQNSHWSPDGAQIMFESMFFDSTKQNAPAYRTFIMNSDGADIKSLTDQEEAALTLSWAEQAGPRLSHPSFKYQTTSPGIHVGCAVWHP